MTSVSLASFDHLPALAPDEVVTTVTVTDHALPEGAGTLALLTLDNGQGPRRPATLGPATLLGLGRVLDEQAARAAAGEIQALAVTGVEGTFAAGADLSLIAGLTDDVGRDLALLGHAVYDRLAALEIPTVALVNGLALGGGLVATSASASAPTGGVRAATTATTPVVPFKRTSTYPVHQNLPAGVDPAAETVAEISSVSPDGKTLAYTDAAGKRVGILDISNPAAPKGLGSIDLSAIENAEPTSVSIIGGYLVVVVDTSASYTDPSGRAIVYRLSDRTRVRTFQLGGQPDSIAVSKDGAYAAIAIENERDESATPAYGTKGGLPQYPAGRIAVLDLARSPWRWAKNDVRLTAYSGAALASLSEAGLDTPRDPEPEYVSINGRNQLAVTLQENNGVVLIDLATRKITKVFSVGNAKVTGIDTAKDGKFSFTGGIDLPREPDALAWIDDRYLATANEGDWKGGTRGWSIFDSTTGEVVWDAGSSFEHLAVRHGLHNEDRAGKKGTEPEGVSVATIGGHRYAFVGSERSNFVAVYLLDNPTKPVFQQILATTNGPEGILPIPGRKMLAVSSEVDDADAGVRSSVNLFRMSSTANGFPSIVSKDDENGAPIGWGALGALTEDAGKPGHLYAASDSAVCGAGVRSARIEAKNGAVSSRPKLWRRATSAKPWTTRSVANPVSSARSTAAS